MSRVDMLFIWHIYLLNKIKGYLGVGCQ